MSIAARRKRKNEPDMEEYFCINISNIQHHKISMKILCLPNVRSTNIKNYFKESLYILNSFPFNEKN